MGEDEAQQNWVELTVNDKPQRLRNIWGSVGKTTLQMEQLHPQVVALKSQN